MQHETLAEQLKAVSPAIVELHPSRKDNIQIVARLEEGESFVPGSWIEFRPVQPDKKLIISNSLHLFSQMKEALRRLTGDYSWSIRHASQIRRENMPFLHSSNTRCIMFDPFMPFRDPLREFFHTRVFLWQIFESNAYYFKTQQEAKNVAAELEMLKSITSATKE